MTEAEEKYRELLRFMWIDIPDNSNIWTKPNKTSIDNVHDAIVYVGVEMQHRIKFYAHKAKQFRVNENWQKSNRNRIVEENIFEVDELSNHSKQEYEYLKKEYNFNDEEWLFVKEIIAGIHLNKSVYTRRVQQRLLRQIREKCLKGINGHVGLRISNRCH